MKRRIVVNQGPSARGLSCVYGVHAVAARLAANPPQVTHLYVRDELSSRVAALTALAEKEEVPVTHVPPGALRDRCGSDQHQGVVAQVPPFRYADPTEVVAGGVARVLVLDQLSDPHNFGALLRTAEAAGVGLVIIPKDGAVGVTATVEKAAAGAAMRVPVARVTNIARTLRELKDAGYWIVGLAAKAAVDVFHFEPPPRAAVVLGGESGLRRLVQEACDELLSIPMQGETESLNVSVAGAVALYALRPKGSSATESARGSHATAQQPRRA
jgi:23S rRNA (guanosine2251-2'-O)-methyltransferase